MKRLQEEQTTVARFDRLTVLNATLDQGVIPIFYHPDAETACSIAQACADAGARVFEYTNRGDFAFEVYGRLEKFCRERLPQMILGAGSIVDAPTAALYIAQGANFVVAPSLNSEVARLCNRRKVPYLPGCGSATEIAEAEELGCEILKIFPGSSFGGPSFVKALLGPCPWTRLLPTSVVEPTEESMAAWFDAGVACVGMGTNLITPDLMAAGDFATLTRNIREVLAIARRHRPRREPSPSQVQGK
jgi:2-dehydro-3-deoxyphosphogluconate aldolase/(4S)-4-hydroxy-2-oxoglutarate aldolase